MTRLGATSHVQGIRRLEALGSARVRELLAAYHRGESPTPKPGEVPADPPEQIAAYRAERARLDNPGGLTSEEIERCKVLGIDPEHFAAAKARMASRKPSAFTAAVPAPPPPPPSPSPSSLTPAELERCRVSRIDPTHFAAAKARIRRRRR